MSILQEYSDLIALAKACLQEESSTWLPSDLESYTYFKSYATQKKSLKDPTHLPETPYKSKPPIIQQSPTPRAVETKKIDPVLPAPLTASVIAPVEKNLKEKKVHHPELFALTPLKPISLHDLLDVKKTVQALWPAMPLLDKPNISEPKILLLFKEAEKKERAFLSHLAKALQTLGSTKLLPLSKFQASHYPKLKMAVLTKDADLIKEGSVHHFELAPIAEYLQNPKLKANLWKALKDALFY